MCITLFFDYCTLIKINPIFVKINKMKIRKFENVKLNQEVTFEEKGMIETGVVCEIKENTFTVRALRGWNKNGLMCYNDSLFNFFKTGTKSHSHYTYGNAISIINNI